MYGFDQHGPLAPACLIGERLAVVPALVFEGCVGGKDVSQPLIVRTLCRPGEPCRVPIKPQPQQFVTSALGFALVFLMLQDGCLGARPDIGGGAMPLGRAERLARKRECNPLCCRIQRHASHGDFADHELDDVEPLPWGQDVGQRGGEQLPQLMQQFGAGCIVAAAGNLRVTAGKESVEQLLAAVV